MNRKRFVAIRIKEVKEFRLSPKPLNKRRDVYFDNYRLLGQTENLIPAQEPGDVDAYFLQVVPLPRAIVYFGRGEAVERASLIYTSSQEGCLGFLHYEMDGHIPMREVLDLSSTERSIFIPLNQVMAMEFSIDLLTEYQTDPARLDDTLSQD